MYTRCSMPRASPRKVIVSKDCGRSLCAAASDGEGVTVIAIKRGELALESSGPRKEPAIEIASSRSRESIDGDRLPGEMWW